MYKYLTIIILTLVIPVAHADIIEYYDFTTMGVFYDVLLVDTIKDFPEVCLDDDTCVIHIQNEYGEIFIIIFILYDEAKGYYV